MNWAVRDIHVQFAQRPALDGVSFDIEPGHVHAVIGGDGAGKSTLLKVLAGLDVGQTGSTRLPPPERIGFVPSSGGIFGDLTVDENIEFVANAYRLRDWRNRAVDLLDRAAIGQFGSRIAGRMSGGQRRKLAGCMALLPQPELLVLDEVTTGVDPVSRMELWRLVATAAGNGAAVVAATTYLDEAERMQHVLLLHEGRALASGTPAAIVAGIRGTVEDLDYPTRPDTAWRAGRRWRQWSPSPVGDRRPVTLTLEDAAIVLELGAGHASRTPTTNHPEEILS
jgi:ABC-2 type transport system ATP-binding protein